MPKEKKPLEPQFERKDNSNINKEELLNIAKELKDSTVIKMSDSESSDSYFKHALDKLFDDSNVSSKTEYLNVRENFIGSKLEFYAKFGNMPYLKNFVNIFEIKRISLERRGRKEILMGLQEKKQEVESQRMNNLKNLFNV